MRLALHFTSTDPTRAGISRAARPAVDLENGARAEAFAAVIDDTLF
jgi:hypothetical protein